MGYDYPTFVELICHTWAGMIHGGKSLWPYASHDLNDRAALFEGMRYIFTSFEAVEELILMGKRSVLLRNNDAEAVLYDNGDEKMFVLVNFTQQPQTVTIENLSGTWHEFRGSRTFTGNTFEMKPLETIIGTNVAKDTGLPTYDETAALIDKLEYERTHRGSLLFERRKDIGITASGSVGSTTKLFDGIPDNYAWGQVGDMEKFYELDLTKLQPTIKTFVVHGWNIGDMELKVRKGDELTVPAVQEVQTEEFSKTYVFQQPICPEALRMEFPARRVELYELEAF